MAKKALFGLIWIVSALVLVFILTETALRIAGKTPRTPPRHNVKIDPPGSIFKADSVLGYVNRPGQFKITLNDQLTFEATHDSLGYRVNDSWNKPDLSGIKHESFPFSRGNGNVLDKSSHIKSSKIEDFISQKEIWILGGSFTYGWGVNDNETFPALLGLPKVRNFGVGGYGTLQTLLQLQGEIRRIQNSLEPKLPKTVVLAYASFHDQRNTCNNFWLNAIAPHNVLKGLRFPYARFSARAESELKYGYQESGYPGLPGAGYSAFINSIQQIRDSWQEDKLRSPEVTRILIQEIIDLCDHNDINFVLMGLEGDEATLEMLYYFQEKGVNTVSIILSANMPENYLQPIDPHPSVTGQQWYAKNLKEYLSNRHLN